MENTVPGHTKQLDASDALPTEKEKKRQEVGENPGGEEEGEEEEREKRDREGQGDEDRRNNGWTLTCKNTGHFGHEAFDGPNRYSRAFILHPLDYSFHLKHSTWRSQVTTCGKTIAVHRNSTHCHR